MNTKHCNNMTARKNKATNYFSHDSNARNDEKVIRLRMKHNAAGYGVYFMILERLREADGYMSVKDYNVIAFDFRVDAALVKSVVEDFGLFVFTDDGKYFYSESFKRRMSMKDMLRAKRSVAGKKGNEERWAKEDKGKDKQEAVPPIHKPAPKPKDEPLPKDEPIQTEQTSADNNDVYLKRFFRKSNQANIEALLMNFGLQPADLAKFRKLAKEVVSEWKATDKSHTDYTDWSRHLVSTMRIKCNASSNTERKKPDKEHKPPASSDYTYDGGFGSKDT